MLRKHRMDDWKQQGNCRDADINLFYPTEDKDWTPTAGKAVCVGCPVKGKCLDYGIKENLGVWGGTSPIERRQIARMREIKLNSRLTCGTNAGYERHRRKKEEICTDCRAAHNELQAEKRSNV